MIEVTLTNQELTTAALVGVRRQLSAMATGRADWGVLASTREAAFDHHILGAMAELAVAMTFNLFWHDNVGKINKIDVGGIIEVRSRRENGSGRDLAMRAHDKPNKPYLLVHANPPTFKLIGWMRGDEAWEIGEENLPHMLKFVHAKALRDIEELFDVIESYFADLRDTSHDHRIRTATRRANGDDRQLGLLIDAHQPPF